MESRKLFETRKDFLTFCLVVFCIFIINLFFSWQTYSKITAYSYCKTKAEVRSVNIRQKDSTLYSAIEFVSIDGYRFYSSKYYNATNLQGEVVEVVFDSSKIGFIDFLRGFRAKCFDIEIVQNEPKKLQKIASEFIASQHEDERLQKIFVSLFFETRLPDNLQKKINEFGLSAVMSLSGLNLTLLVGLIFMVLNRPYRFFQERYFPYRNRNFDILLFSLSIMIFYAYLVDFTKPFVRALIMACVAFVLSLRGIKIVSFSTLFMTMVIIVAFSPSSLFSIGLWLSFAGVYYIFLFLHNMSELNGVKSYLLLGVFVFLTMSVIARILFPLFSLAQLSSPITSILFDFFYPVEVVLHLVSLGWIFDALLVWGLDISVESIELATPDWFFYFFVCLSIAAYFRREAFWSIFATATMFTIISTLVAVT